MKTTQANDSLSLEKAKKPKKKKLSDYAEEARKAYNGACTKKKRCCLLAAVVAVHAENTHRPAFEDAFSFNVKTGKTAGTQLVYFVRNTEFAVVEFCPFCGGKLR